MQKAHGHCWRCGTQNSPVWSLCELYRGTHSKLRHSERIGIFSDALRQRCFASGGKAKTSSHEQQAPKTDIASSLDEAIMKRVRQVESRFDELESTLQDLPTSEIGRAHKELASLRPLALLAKSRDEKVMEIEELQRILDSPAEQEFSSIAATEADECRVAIRKLEAQMLAAIMPKDSADDKGAYIELRMGAGGVEAQIFAMDILEMYQNYAQRKGWTVDVMDMHDGSDSRGLREATINVKGEGVFRRLKYESGVHRVQRVPETESLGRTHTSTMTVAILPIPEEADVNIRATDLRIDVYRASGAGGQHVNKTESAVRVTHIPTGIVVAIQDSRSQHQNKDKALQLVRAKLYEMERARLQAIRDTQRSQLIGTGERHERIRTYNYPQGRVTDHRVPVTVYGIESMMEGQLLDQIVDALVMKEQEDYIKSLSESD